MSGPGAARLRRLRSLREVAPGWLWVALCRGCGHRGALPVAQFLARWGDLLPVEAALARMRCSACGGCEVKARLLRLCDPGCPRQRG